MIGNIVINETPKMNSTNANSVLALSFVFLLKWYLKELLSLLFLNTLLRNSTPGYKQTIQLSTMIQAPRPLQKHSFDCELKMQSYKKKQQANSLVNRIERFLLDGERRD